MLDFVLNNYSIFVSNQGVCPGVTTPLIIQVLAIEFVLLAIDFVPLANEFVLLANEFVLLVIEFGALARGPTLLKSCMLWLKS